MSENVRSVARRMVELLSLNDTRVSEVRGRVTNVCAPNQLQAMENRRIGMSPVRKNV